MENSWPTFNYRGPAVALDDVCAYEATIGATFPDDYRAFLVEVNGGQPDTHAVFIIRRGRSTLNALHSLNDPDEMSNIAEANDILRESLPRELVAIGADDGGSTICLCLHGDHRGEVWYYDTIDPRPEGANPRVLWHDRRDFTKLADTFRAFTSALAPR